MSTNQMLGGIWSGLRRVPSTQKSRSLTTTTTLRQSHARFATTTGLKKLPIVKELRAYVVQETECGADYHRQQKGHWIIDTPIANPMTNYPEYRKSRTRYG
jgi:hypothetical protein